MLMWRQTESQHADGEKRSIGKLILELRGTFPDEASPRLPGYCWYIFVYHM